MYLASIRTADLCDQMTFERLEALLGWNNSYSYKHLLFPKSGADPGFPIGGFYLFKCARSAREKFEATPTLSKARPFSYVFTSSQSQFTAATDLRISNLAKVSESTFRHDSTS